MRKKLISIILVSIIAMSSLSISLIALLGRSSATSLPEPMVLGTDYFGRRDIDISEFNGESTAPSDSYGPSASAMVGDIQYWFVYDDYYGWLFYEPYILMYDGVYCEVWVQLDLNYYIEDNYITGNNALQDRDADVITAEQATYMGMEYDQNIHLTMIDYFGIPFPLYGEIGWADVYDEAGNYESPEGKTAILLSNVRDVYYYNPDYPLYIAGFYWGYWYEPYFDRNVITIDTLAWYYYVGEGPTYEDFQEQSTFRYEATFAHEFQHLIHDDYNPSDDTFMNEGCSMFAELVCGYPVDYSVIDDYFRVPDNSLIIWEDLGPDLVLSDYGQALLWTTYLNDQYGDDFISYFVQTGIPGVDGINNALETFGFEDTFDDAFHNWRIANLIHSNMPGWGKFNYKSIDLDYAIENELIEPIRVYELEGKFVPPTTGTSFGTSFIQYGDTIYDSGVSRLGTYGSDYIKFTKLSGWTGIGFDGDDTYWYGWQETPYGWWSDAADNLNTIMTAEAFVDPSDPTLRFWTWYYIEDYWDFGFVQVSTDNGETWSSLENLAYTTDVIDGPLDLEPWATMYGYLPGLTGYSGGWVYMEFDLSVYVDQSILIGFRYMTDWYTHYNGWYVDEVSVSGVELEIIPPEYPYGEYLVTIVVEQEWKHRYHYFVYDVHLHDMHDIGLVLDFIDKRETYYMIISPINPAGTVDYKVSAISFKNPFKWH